MHPPTFLHQIAAGQKPELPAGLQAKIADAVARHMREHRIPGHSLDDPVQHDCPAYGVRPWPVTLRDC